MRDEISTASRVLADRSADLGDRYVWPGPEPVVAHGKGNKQCRPQASFDRLNAPQGATTATPAK
jgi:hypothetical protein